MLFFSDSSGVILDVNSRLKAICPSTYNHLHSTHSTPAYPSTRHPPSSLVRLSSHVLVGPSMCAILFRLNANRQIKEMVLEQYSIIDFSCTLPVGWHPYYTDKWSKSQGCVSAIKKKKKNGSEVEIEVGVRRGIHRANVWRGRLSLRGRWNVLNQNAFMVQCHPSILQIMPHFN